MIISAVLAFRRRHPELGTRKLQNRLNQLPQFHSCPIGRDHLFRLLRSQRLLIRRKRRFVVTTNSRHGWHYYPNLLIKTPVTAPNQAMVADITYLRLQRGFCYLFLLTDVYSRRIMGYQVSRDLGAENAVKVLNQAKRQIPVGSQVIHHSDRGIQYSCPRFTEAASGSGFRVSMTEKDHVYENAKAERLNGILKQEYHLGSTLCDIEMANKMVREAVKKYNEERPHLALNYQTPDEVYFGKRAS